MDLRDLAGDRGHGVHDLVLHHRGPRLVRLLRPDASSRLPPWACSTTTGSSTTWTRRRSTSACARSGAAEKEMELQVVPNLDLSSTEWPDFPNSEVMNAGDLRGARPRERLPGPLRVGRPRGAGRAPRRRSGADRVRERRDRAAPGGGAPAPVAGRRAGHALAVVPPLPADGRARGRAAGGRGLGRRRGRPRGDARRRHRPDARDGGLQPERPDRRLPAVAVAALAAVASCPSTSTCCSTRPTSTSRTSSRSTRA